MITPDLRKIGTVRPIEVETQQIVLKRWTAPQLNEWYYYLATPDVPQMTRLYETKSLHYASHSTHFGIVGPSLLQLSLAICLRLYSVSRAIAYHKEFAGKFLIDLPHGKFMIEKHVPI